MKRLLKNKLNLVKKFQSILFRALVYLRSMSIDSLKNLISLAMTFSLVLFLYYTYYGISYQRLTVDSINNSILAQIKNTNVLDNKFVYVDFNNTGLKDLVGIKTNSTANMSDGNINYITEAPELYVFSEINKNFFDDLFSKEKLHTIKDKITLEKKDDFGNFWYSPVSLKKIDILKDGYEEILMCLGGNTAVVNATFKCSIFNGTNFIFYIDTDSDNSLIYDDENDRYFSIELNWDEESYLKRYPNDGTECHTCPHLYRIHEYKFFPNSLIYSNDKYRLHKVGEYLTSEDYRGKPDEYVYDTLMKNPS